MKDFGTFSINNMKKPIVAILALLYLSTSAGTTVYFHYCMGKLVNWSLWESSGKNCSICGMHKSNTSSKNGCCKDEVKQIKSEKDQKLTESTFNLIQLTSVAVPTSQVELGPLKISSITEANPISHSPPRGQVAIYIRNCIFRI